MLNTISEPSEEGYGWSAHDGRFQHYTGCFKHDTLHKREFRLRQYVLNTLYHRHEGYFLGDKLIECSLDMIDQAEDDELSSVIYFWFCFLHEQLLNNLPLGMTSSDDFYSLGIAGRLDDFVDQICPVAGYTIEDFVQKMAPVLNKVKQQLPFTLLASPFDVLKTNTLALTKEWLGVEKEMMDGHDLKVIYEKLCAMEAPASHRWQAFLDPSFAQDFSRISGILIPDDIEYTAICWPFHPEKECDYIIFLSSVQKAQSYDGCSCDYELARYLTSENIIGAHFMPDKKQEMIDATAREERAYMTRPIA